MAGGSGGKGGTKKPVSRGARSSAASETPDLFEHAPIALWLEDVGDVFELFDSWKADGVEDLQAFLAEDPQRVWACNERLTILRINRAGLDLFGVGSVDELLERREELFPPVAFPIFIEQLLAMWEGRSTMQQDGRFKDADGRIFDAAVAMRFLDEGERRFMLATLTDITDRRDVARRLAAQARDLARTNAELEQFANLVSHDLRTPLRQIASFGQLLSRRHADDLDPAATGWIEHIVAGVGRMDEMLTSLDEYTRLGGDPDTFQNVPLGDLARRVIKEIEDSRAGGLDWRIVYGPLPVVFGDHAQLAVVLRCLLENALKFRGEERLRVSLTAEEGADGEWIIAVRDNGVGIDPRQGARIFEVFQRGHSSDRSAGAGLGLALAKKVVQRHGGRIWYESAPGEGTAFHFTLPAPPLAKLPPPPAA